MTTEIRSLNGKAAGLGRDTDNKKEVKEIRAKVNNSKNYKERIKYIEGLKPIYTGKGIRHHNPYKVSPNGQYGNLIINLRR